MNIPKIFKPEDFYSGGSDTNAQRIFEKWLKENGKVVYGRKAFMTDTSIDHDSWSSTKTSNDKQKALLVCIEELKPKEECEHRFVFQICSEFIKDRNVLAYCETCKKGFRPSGWEVV